MADIFISYKRENQDAVQNIVRGLRGAGSSVWWDQDIAPDAPWEATIEGELEKAKVVLVAWSRAAVASENVKAEARRARTQGKLIQTYVESCDPPLFFGERQGVDLSGWRGDPSDNRFKVLVAAAKAVAAGRRPPQGVGHAPRKRPMWPRLVAAAALVSVAMIGLNVSGSRDRVCSASGLTNLCATLGLAAREADAGADVPSASTPPSGEAIVGERAAPVVQPGASPQLEVLSGQAMDFDRGIAADQLTDGSDFILSGNAGGFSIASVAPPAAVGVAWSGTPTPAACSIEPARPEIGWAIPLANDVGEYQCFTTSEGRLGAFVLQRSRPGLNGVVIVFMVWER